jgi:hypothetical protein
MRIVYLVLLPICLAMGALRTTAQTLATPPAAAKSQRGFVLEGYDGDPQKDKPEKFNFQIGVANRRRPSEFLKLGEVITGTPFKLLKFQFKETWNSQTKEREDASELTILNTVTGKTAVLPYNKAVDVSAITAPDSAGK